MSRKACVYNRHVECTDCQLCGKYEKVSNGNGKILVSNILQK